MGINKGQEAKNITLRVRVTLAEYRALERVIQREGLGKSEVMRLLLQEGAQKRGIAVATPGGIDPVR